VKALVNLKGQVLKKEKGNAEKANLTRYINYLKRKYR
jgi:hypothetical protein